VVAPAGETGVTGVFSITPIERDSLYGSNQKYTRNTRNTRKNPANGTSVVRFPAQDAHTTRCM
jgi:hypothetical protein